MSSKKDQAMSNMKTNFREFHQELSKFCNSLLKMFEKKDLSELTHVKVIPAVLTPSDPDFDVENITSIIKKWVYLKGVIERTLANIGKFLESQHFEWFSDQKTKLEWWVFVVNMSAVALGFENHNTEADFLILGAGIGGANLGTADARAKLEMLKRDRDITALLKCIESK
ncbi:unnamed protein product [Lymnaea stagnalis]|uniref:Uncharacterized protein n=1 Tax=Lymnaea stagnalis TaxID=6523 RepID=A0AAV2GYR3_LYMST